MELQIAIIMQLQNFIKTFTKDAASIANRFRRKPLIRSVDKVILLIPILPTR